VKTKLCRVKALPGQELLQNHCSQFTMALGPCDKNGPDLNQCD